MLHILYALVIQLPQGTRNPDDNSPIDLTNPFDLIVYVILPILIVIFYIFWRRSKRRNKD